MDNQAKDLKLEKDKTRLSQTWGEKIAKRELENAKKRKQALEENKIWMSHVKILSTKVFLIWK